MTTAPSKAKTSVVDTLSGSPLVFSCLVKNLVEIATVVVNIVPAKTTLPVLECVLLSAPNDETLSLSANNLELYVTGSLKASIDTRGSVLVGARRFLSWLKVQDPDARVNAVYTAKANAKLVLKVGTARLELSTWAPVDFPPRLEPREPDSKESAQLDAGAFRQLVKHVAFAAAPDSTRPILAGVLLRLGKDSVTMAAADGFRLAEERISLQPRSADAGDVDLIVPHETLGELLKIIDPDDVEVEDEDKKTPREDLTLTWWTCPIATLRKDEPASKREIDVLVIDCASYTIQSRAIDGQFPDYERIIPTESECSVILQVQTDALQRAVRAANGMARDNSSIVRFHIAGDGLAVSGTSAEMGEATDLVKYDALKQSEPDAVFQIAFNGRYLVDLLRAMPEATRISFKGSGSPGLFVPVGQASEMRQVVMPMHVAR